VRTDRATVALTVAGAAAGIVVAALISPGYLATTTLVVRANGAPAALPTVAELATSDVVVHNVAAALHLPDARVRRHLHASSVGRSALVRLRYRDSSDVRARQVVQQAATVLQSVAAPRLGGGVRVDTIDPARTRRAGRAWARDALVGALVGLLAGLVLPFARRAPQRRPERRIEAHDLLAQVRGALARREREFDEAQLLEWYALLGVLAAETEDGALAPPLERVARERFAPLLGP
jgi:capsular polysaccharide biosynthesis protein